MYSVLDCFQIGECGGRISPVELLEEHASEDGRVGRHRFVLSLHVQAGADVGRVHHLLGLACVGNALRALRSTDLSAGHGLPPAVAASAP